MNWTCACAAPAENCLARTGQRLQLAQRALDAISPLATLERAMPSSRARMARCCRMQREVKAGDEIEARLRRGSLKARVT